MKDDSLMRRLRAAKSVTTESGDHAALFTRIVAEPGDPRLVEAPRERSSRLAIRKVRSWTSRRPRVLAGSTLGLAGIGAALVLALSAGGAAAPPAFAITHKADGSVLVKFNTVTDGQKYHGYLYAVDHMLVAKYQEEILVGYAPGPATVPGPVSCTPTRDADPGLPKTPVNVLFGTDGTAVIPSGTTGAGTVHLSNCELYIDAPGTYAGNSGVGNSTS